MTPHFLKYALAILSGLLLFTACELDGVKEETYSYARIFNINLVYADSTYTFTYNGVAYDSIGEYVLSKDTIGTLRAYRGDKLELDSTIHFTPWSTMSLIQLPGEKIKFYDANAAESEPAPTDSTCNKARFIYKADYHAADSLRFIWLSSTKASLTLPGAMSQSFDTIVAYKNKLSAYVEFDTDKYRAAGSSTYFYYMRQTWNGTAWSGTTKTTMTNTTITGATYKFATFRILTSEFSFLFGTTWK
ncbi:MAG: hypothetical protein H6Q20_993 [Bacteroidetes bacterium]|nr:hypothetical protein [Bacteroidota bacterium]